MIKLSIGKIASKLDKKDFEKYKKIWLTQLEEEPFTDEWWDYQSELKEILDKNNIKYDIEEFESGLNTFKPKLIIIEPWWNKNGDVDLTEWVGYITREIDKFFLFPPKRSSMKSYIYDPRNYKENFKRKNNDGYDFLIMCKGHNIGKIITDFDLRIFDIVIYDYTIIDYNLGMPPYKVNELREHVKKFIGLKLDI